MWGHTMWTLKQKRVSNDHSRSHLRSRLCAVGGPRRMGEKPCRHGENMQAPQKKTKQTEKSTLEHCCGEASTTVLMFLNHRHSFCGMVHFHVLPPHLLLKKQVLQQEQKFSDRERLPLLMSWYSNHSCLWTCLLGYQMVHDSWKP